MTILQTFQEFAVFGQKMDLWHTVFHHQWIVNWSMIMSHPDGLEWFLLTLFVCLIIIGIILILIFKWCFQRVSKLSKCLVNSCYQICKSESKENGIEVIAWYGRSRFWRLYNHVWIVCSHFRTLWNSKSLCRLLPSLQRDSVPL